MNKFAVFLLPLLVSGCLLESVSPIDRSIKPFGAHWVKEGMTRESRRDDLAACGSVSGNEDVRFKDEQVEAARQVAEPNAINAYLRLRDLLGQCMSARGYQPVGDLKYLGGCDESCMYP
jgi:hypothetical protein